MRTDTKNVPENKINDLQRGVFNFQTTQKHVFGYSLKSSLFFLPLYLFESIFFVKLWNTHSNVPLKYQIPLSSLEDTPVWVLFSTLFSVFDAMKHCASCFTLIIVRNSMCLIYYHSVSVYQLKHSFSCMIITTRCLDIS